MRHFRSDDVTTFRRRGGLQSLAQCSRIRHAAAVDEAVERFLQALKARLQRRLVPEWIVEGLQPLPVVFQPRKSFFSRIFELGVKFGIGSQGVQLILRMGDDRCFIEQDRSKGAKGGGGSSMR